MGVKSGAWSPAHWLVNPPTRLRLRPCADRSPGFTFRFSPPAGAACHPGLAPRLSSLPQKRAHSSQQGLFPRPQGHHTCSVSSDFPGFPSQFSSQVHFPLTHPLKSGSLRAGTEAIPFLSLYTYLSSQRISRFC